ncbi:MAG: signal peptide peptidase SppA [Deltaproteobacteria bacterium]|nr:signal peptide peptidase SppA [Deltaproteobacteria bacterium]
MNKRRIRLVVILILAVVVGFLLLRGGGPEIEPGSTLVLTLEGQYVEAQRPPLFARLLGEPSRPFVSLLSTLAVAERDDRIDTVVLVLRPVGIGWGKAGELHAAIRRLSESGRRTIAFLDVSSFSASRLYFVATAADEIIIVPGGTVPVVGLAAEYFFLGGLWEKLGITFEVGKAGRYKSAVEAISDKQMSEASREMANSLLDSTHRAFIEAIAEGRDMSVDEVMATIDKGPMQPVALEALGLVDGSRHLDEVLDELGEKRVMGREYAQVDPSDVGFDPVAEVALIYGSGTVVPGRGTVSRSGDPVMAAETVSKAILDAAQSPDVDAIILRIDSPGGSALAAEQIHRAIVQARSSNKPIVASFSDLAASGGYYVAAAADSIVSAPGTLTGSIGVFALRPVLGGALDKLGVGRETLLRGRYADFLSVTEPLSDATRARLQDLVLDTYSLFLERVADGRDMTLEEVDAVAQGRVWTGRQALEVGLVDELGGLRTAVDRVREELDLEADADVVLVPFPAPRSLGEELAEALSGRLRAIVLGRLALPGITDHALIWLTELPPSTPLLVPPVLVDIH